MLMSRTFLQSFLHRPTISITSLTAASLILSSSMSSASASSSQQTYNTVPYKPRHNTWPYKPSDFDRSDPSSDTDFYSAPRFVTHIDDAAIASLRSYYDTSLPRSGRILDFCSSWISHYPASISEAAKNGALKIVGMGMNQKELAANDVLNAGRILQDLNTDPVVPLTVCGEQAASGMPASVGGGGDAEAGLLDASTCVVSIDYLIHPVEVLSSLRERTKTGGSVHLVISNRCFPTKAVGRWLRVSEPERLMMVGDFLWFAGWRRIEILDLKAGEDEQGGGVQEQQGGLSGFMKMMGMGGNDPLWVVRAVKE